MDLKNPNTKIHQKLLEAQRNEITGHLIYENLSKSAKGNQWYPNLGITVGSVGDHLSFSG